MVKLDVYVTDLKSMRLIQQYLSHRKQKIKIGNAYSSWKKFFYTIPQESILGPLISSILLYDLFYFLDGDTVASYSDDTTPYSVKPLNTNPTKWSNTLKQFVDCCRRIV